MRTVHVVTCIEFVRDAKSVYSSHTMGYFFEFAMAEAAVLANALDIAEGGSFHHAVIETMPPGLYPQSDRECWYRWADSAFRPCEKPAEAAGIRSWGMG